MSAVFKTHDGAGWVERAPRRWADGAWVTLRGTRSAKWWENPATTHTVTGTIRDTLTGADNLNGTKQPHPARARRINIPAGTYEEQIGSIPYGVLVGQGATPADTVVHWTNTVEGGLQRQYPLEVIHAVYLENLTFHGEAKSYALHADATSTPGVPTQLIARNCVFRNTFGDVAVGLGSGAYQEMYFQDCRFETTGGMNPPILGHNSKSQAAPSLVVFENCHIVSQNEGIHWSDIGSGQPDVWIYTGGSIAAPYDPDLRARATLPATVDTATLQYYLDAGYTTGGDLAPTVSRAIPSPVPQPEDATNGHNAHFANIAP